MTAQTTHARPHARTRPPTAQTAHTAHPPVRGAGWCAWSEQRARADRSDQS